MKRLIAGIAWVASWFRSRAASARSLQLATLTEADLRAQIGGLERDLELSRRNESRSNQATEILEHKVRMLEGTIEVNESQLETLAAWQQRELGRLHAEAAIEARRKVRAMEAPHPQEDMI